MKPIKLPPLFLSLVLLANCAVPFDPATPLEEDHGFAVAIIHLPGLIKQAKLMTYNKNKVFNLHQLVAQGNSSVIVVPMTAGTHSFDKGFYMQGSDLIKPSLECLGSFEIRANQII